MTSPPSRWLTLPGAPAIPGLRVRAYGGPDDIPAIAALYGIVNRVDGNPEVWTAEELRLEYEEWTNVDPREDDLLAFVEDRARGHVPDRVGGQQRRASLLRPQRPRPS